MEGALTAALAQPTSGAEQGAEGGTEGEAHAAALCSLLLAVDRWGDKGVSQMRPCYFPGRQEQIDNV